MKKTILFLMIVALTTNVYAQKISMINDSFVASTYMSRNEGMCIEAYFALGGNLYAGIGESRTDELTNFYKYSIADNTWTRLKDFPGNRYRWGAISFTYNGKGYFGLGGSAAPINSDIWEYDPTSDSWSKFTDFPDGSIYHAAVFVIDNYAYIGSGALIDQGEISRSDFWKLNMNTKQWTKIASIPQPLERGAGFAINGKGYLAGGEYIYSDTYRNQLLEYDPQVDAWTVKLTDSNNLHFREARAGVVGDEAYIFYGNVCQVSKYNQTTNALTPLADFIGLGEERYDALCAVYDGSIYYGLGDYVDASWYAQYPRDLWKLEIAPPSTGVNPVNKSILIVSKMIDGQVKISGMNAGEHVMIYTISGLLLYNQSATTDNVSIKLPDNGIYIVRIGEKSIKILN